MHNTEFKDITMKLADIKVGEPNQSLNEDERVADRAWAAARAQCHLAPAGAGPKHNVMVWAVDHAYCMELRMATTWTTRPPMPDPKMFLQEILVEGSLLLAATITTELTRKLQHGSYEGSSWTRIEYEIN